MDLLSIVDRTSCAVDAAWRTKEQAIQGIATLAAQSEAAAGIPAETIEAVIAKRESEGSTGFGNEVAIPHARVAGMKRFLVFVVALRRGVDFDALDRKRVRLFFVILGPPEEVNTHLQILALISRMVAHTNAKAELLRAESRDALHETFLKNAGLNHATPEAKRKMKLLFVNVYLEEFLYQILELFLEEGIEGATIIDSAGMGQYISDVPLFADFIGFMREKRHKSKSILALVPENMVDSIIDGIEAITGDMETRQGAMVMSLEIGILRGNMNMI